MKYIIHKDWFPVWNLQHQEPLLELREKILPEISYEPEPEDIFNAFTMSLKDIKVVILGQDPYPSPNIATGLAFAVKEDAQIPVSLNNVMIEIQSCLDISNGERLKDLVDNVKWKLNSERDIKWRTLEHWKDQGVFLLNTALTVETGKSGSHLKYWEEWTKRVITHISMNNPCIWVLWGSKAKSYTKYIKGQSLNVNGYDKETIQYIPINNDYNYVMTAGHPASEAYQNNAGFFGCNHFYYVNSILKNKSLNEIKW